MSRFQRALEERIANPLLRAVLRSRFHWLASEWLLLVSYVGPRSGRPHTFPVAYHRLDGAVVAVTPKRESDWWRNFRDSRDCRVWLRGAERGATGDVVTGAERGALLAEYFESHRLLGRMLGPEVGPGATPDQLADANPDLSVVRFTLDEP
ncbi:MAG: nitroreductase/quinone reductase family protein [Halobacteriaceae archaeon]